jgi:hypothetical protein
MKGRKLDEVADAVMALIDRWVAKDNIPFTISGKVIFKQALQDTIERAAGGK